MSTSGPDIYSIQETPNWVKPYSVPEISATGDSPFTFPLVDYQERIGTSDIQSYRNTYQCVNDASRIEDASLHLTELHQGSQCLLIHELSVIRDGEKIDALDAENISAIQRERSLESHITDNRITVSISIDDLRVGDHVQFRSTVIENQNDHPFLGRHFSANYSLSWSCPVSLQVIRVVNDSTGKLTTLQETLNGDGDEPLIETIEAGQEFEKHYTDLPMEQIPDAVPEWVWGSYLQVTSAMQWTDLSCYLSEYFDKHGALAELSLNTIEQLDIFTPTDNLETRALNVIRFVQNNVRYRGENHGVFTHTPKPPERTLSKRAGDCKDKSNLLRAMLDAIGVHSRLVLVNTRYGKKLKQFNPSPYHFNHMIVDVHINDKHYYIDATIQKQAGDFEHAALLDYGLGLPLVKPGSQPVNIVKSLSNTVLELVHNFDFSKGEGKPSLSILRTYHFHRADNMRAYFGSSEKAKYEQDFLGWAKGDTSLSLEAVKPVCIEEDDPLLNKIVVREEYRIIDLQKTHDNKPIELLTDFYQNFPIPDSDDFDIRIDLDGRLQHDIFLNYDRRPTLETTEQKISTNEFEYLDIVKELDDNQFHYTTSVTPLKEFVSGSDSAQQHKKDVERMRLRSNNLLRHKNKSITSGTGILDNQFTMYILFVVVCLLIKKLIDVFG